MTVPQCTKKWFGMEELDWSAQSPDFSIIYLPWDELDLNC